MTTESKYQTLRDRVESEVFPRMTNKETRQGMLAILEDPRYALSGDKFAEELGKDDHLQDLIILREEFHKGGWNNMISWFRQVLDSRPYNFKRFSNIALDYARVLQLQEYELKQKVKNTEFNLLSLLAKE